VQGKSEKERDVKRQSVREERDGVSEWVRERDGKRKRERESKCTREIERTKEKTMIALRHAHFILYFSVRSMNETQQKHNLLKPDTTPLSLYLSFFIGFKTYIVFIFCLSLQHSFVWPKQQVCMKFVLTLYSIINEWKS